MRFVIALQLFLSPLLLCEPVEFVQHFAVMVVDGFLDRSDGVAQTSVAELTVPRSDGGRLCSDEALLLQTLYMLRYRLFAQPNCIADGVVAGIALMSHSVLTAEQIGIDHNFSVAQAETENLIGQREVVFDRVASGVSFIVSQYHIPPLVFSSSHCLNLSFGMTMRYRFLRSEIQPYIEAKLGTEYSVQSTYMSTFVSRSDNWGFYASPEIGVTFFPFPKTDFGFQVAVYYSYATNRNKALDLTGLNNLGFKLGIAF